MVESAVVISVPERRRDRRDNNAWLACRCSVYEPRIGWTTWRS